MRIVLGIGNPGREYAETRHNCGFMVLDELARRHGLAFARQKKWEAELSELREPARALLIKPQTYVNLSGRSAQAAMAFHKAAPRDLLVVVDDINLPLGTLRLRGSGSSGGHNGLKDIEARIGQDYPRLRLGIGAPQGDQVGHVLGGFAPQERDDAVAMVAKAADCVEIWLRDGLEAAMRLNGPL